MCGIVGIINLDDKPICLEELKRFRDSIRHRGPADEGVFIRHNVGFGHRRLSIIDLSNKGKQPMIYNDRYVITYNGECYNFEEVRCELKKKGFKFKSDTDTEVILAGYQCWGENIQNKLNGMWAFAIYDLKKNEIFLSRDRFGIKPLYYYTNKNKIAFASEMKSFMFLDEGCKPDFNDDILINLRTHESIEKTFLNNVFSLPAGHSIKIANKKIEIKKWWEINNNLISVNYKNIYMEIFIKETLLNSDFSSYVPFCNVEELKKFIKIPTYTKLKRAFSFCQVYYLKKTFINASSDGT
jgi:asparagine synthase (glutamine-hydrolysing)